MTKIVFALRKLLLSTNTKISILPGSGGGEEKKCKYLLIELQLTKHLRGKKNIRITDKTMKEVEKSAFPLSNMKRGTSSDT